MSNKLMGAKKAIALILSFALFAFTLSGCSTGNSNSTAESSSVQSTQSQVDEGISFPLKEQVKMKLFMIIGEQPMNADSLLPTELKKQTNIDFEIIQVGASVSTDKQAAMLASGDLPDIMCLQGDKSYVYNPDKTPLFLNLKEYYNNGKMPNLKAWTEKYPVTEEYFIDKDSNIFAMPQLLNDNQVTEGFITQKEMLDKYSSGKVDNYDELFNYLKAWKNDNPKKYPWTCISWGLGGWYLIGCQLVMWHNGWSAVDYDYDAKQFAVMPYKQEYKDCITWLAKCYQAGLIDPNFSTNADAQFAENFSSGKSIFAFNYFNNVTNFTTTARAAQNNQNVTFNMIPYPKLPDGKQSTFLAYTPGSTGGWYKVISKNTKYPDIAVAFLDYMLGKNGDTLINYGKLGVTYDLNTAGAKVLRNPLDFKTTGIPNMIRPINYLEPFATDDAGNQLSAAYTTLASNPAALNPRLPTVMVSAEESKKIADITTPAETYIHETVLQFVTGVKPMSDWDSFIAQVKTFNLEYVAETYNNNK